MRIKKIIFLLIIFSGCEIKPKQVSFIQEGEVEKKRFYDSMTMVLERKDSVIDFRELFSNEYDSAFFFTSMSDSKELNKILGKNRIKDFQRIPENQDLTILKKDENQINYFYIDSIYVIGGIVHGSYLIDSSEFKIYRFKLRQSEKYGAYLYPRYRKSSFSGDL